MKTAHFLRKPITTSQDLSAAILDYTTSVGRPFKLEEIHFHASVAITETIKVFRDSANGSNYDALLQKIPLKATQDAVYRPQGECNFLKGDEIKITCTDANGLGTIYVEIKLSEM